MKAVVVIPSYWSRKSMIGWKPGDMVYDHPTPLDEQGTLKRLLDSISILNQRKDVYFVVLAVPTSSDISDDVEKKVKNIVSSVSSDSDIRIVGPRQIQAIKNFLVDNGKHLFSNLVSIQGYSQVRNLCLLIPAVMDADVSVLIDDDEVFEDSDFLFKALHYMNNPIDGTINYGIAGYYLQPNGGYLVRESDSPWSKYWDKNSNMNKAFTSYIGTGPRVKKTPFVFGGNMVIPKAIFSKIPFDPHVPRGEDIDYLMNARMFGFSFYLDNELAIKHLPPPKSHPIWKRLREDIFRFLYERQKIRMQGPNPEMKMISAEEFDPYPGCFLKDDLEEKIKKSNLLLSEHYQHQGDAEGRNEALKNIELAKNEAIPKFDSFQRYCQLQSHWEMFIHDIQVNQDFWKKRLQIS